MDNRVETLGDGKSRQLRILADGDYSQSGGGPDRPDGDDTDRIEAFWAGRSGVMRRSGRTAA